MIKRLSLLGVACLSVVGCADPDRVVFVTDTSIGINVDSKPAAVSLAYDRTEGFIGPRYDNGAVPPVVASIETGGTVFNPEIRQVYATGAAAVLATNHSGAQGGPTELVGGRRLVFFGTTTTLGVKVGFTSEVYPDSLVIGYKRKELSVIPLGTEEVDGKKRDVYPSVLGSIDTTISTVDADDLTSAADRRRAVGLENAQFFATGLAAEALAAGQPIRTAFQVISAESVTASLSKAEREQAIQSAIQLAKAVTSDSDDIIGFIAPQGQLDQSRWNALTAEANKAAAGMVPGPLQQQRSIAAIRKEIEDDPALLKGLKAAKARLESKGGSNG